MSIASEGFTVLQNGVVIDNDHEKARASKTLITIPFILFHSTTKKIIYSGEISIQNIKVEV